MQAKAKQGTAIQSKAIPGKASQFLGKARQGKEMQYQYRQVNILGKARQFQKMQVNFYTRQGKARQCNAIQEKASKVFMQGKARQGNFRKGNKVF